MLFPYIPDNRPLPSAVKIQHENLKRFETDNFSRCAVNALIANRTLFCDQLLMHLWRYFRLDLDELALIAVGGYGRSEMFPLSDLDVLILTDQTITPCTEEKIAAYLQFLWDCGFDVGHSVRTLAQCEQEGKRDITIATNLLEGRYLTGRKTLFDDLNVMLRQPDFWPIRDFFNAKIQEQAERYQRYNNTAYNLEPDIKYSPGGLRDLHLIYWIALRHSNVKNLQEILHSGFIYPAEYELLQSSQQLLFKVRFALHLILKRYDNRLLFDRQLKVAELLGYHGEGNHGVETMMKAFFQALQNISMLSDILAKHYREHFLSSHQSRQRTVLDDNFELFNNAVCLRNAEVLAANPDTVLDLFYHLTAYPQADIHSDTLRKLHLALTQRRGYLSDSAAAREKFIRLFAQPQAIARALVPMHRYGVLTAYLPQWKGIEGLMQFDLFHTYTVDEHTLRVMLKLESFLQPVAVTVHPVCADIFARNSDRTLLYIAALFHDIAKGRGGDHAALGAQEVNRFAERHGFNRRETETVTWLVQSHLLMSVTAQRRDIHDPEVVMGFAAEVGNQVRLDYLTCLTVADICATNETLWNSWKHSLLTTLYKYTGLQFRQGIGRLLDNNEKIADNRRQARILLRTADKPLPIEAVNHFWQRCPDEYFLRNNPKQLAWHAGLLTAESIDFLVKISNRFSQGGTEVFVYCRDRPNLFYNVVCTIGAKKLSIHDAQIITTDDGYALDGFIVTEQNGKLLKFDRRRALEQALTIALRTDKVAGLSSHKDQKLQHFQVKTDVRFLHPNKTEQTEMELFALDKTGLLAEVSRIFSELELNLLHAKITTVGARAEDFFILTNRDNAALTPQQRECLKNRLYRELS